VAAVVYFLKLDGIQGESKDARHAGEIELESFSWGEANVGAGAAGGGGGGAGKVHVDDLHVVTRTSKASPALFLACASGQHFKQAVLTARRAGKAPQEFLVIRLSVPDGRHHGRRPDGSGVARLRDDRVRVQPAEARRVVGRSGQGGLGREAQRQSLGWPVARLMPLEHHMTAYDRLVAEGTITPATARLADLPPPAKLKPGAMTISEALEEQRAERL
jgi:hypothetical protein